VLIGTMVRLSAEWRVPATEDGVLTDPTAVLLTVRLPDASTVTPTPVADAVGRWHADYLPAAAGSYKWRWEGTGAAHASAEGTFAVEASTL
jgi:hypothetical protein